MLIAIDGFELSAIHPVGVGRFEVELLRNIYELDTKNSYRIYAPRKPSSNAPHSHGKWQYRVPGLTRLWSQVTLPLYLQLDNPKPDVFFAPIHYAPRFCPAPTVVGIMDLSFLMFPGYFKKTDLYKLANWTKYSVEGAKAVIAISESTKSDILKNYRIAPEKVHVVYPGVSMSKGTMSNPPAAPERSDGGRGEQRATKYRIHGEYILYVGTLQPRKNIGRLIEAFKIATSHQPLATRKMQLVIVGKKGWLYDEIFETVKKLGLEKEVVFTGYVPDEELPALYKNATCFCLPSLYEGFGFPVLEAMKYGCPVVASNVSSLPELVGEAGILVNPNKTEDIAHGIEKVLSMKDDDRKRLVEKGYQQIKKFTWEKAAKQTIEILEEVGNAH